MPINATRFQFLDEETQVAVQAFKSDLDSGIFNAAKNALLPTSEQLNSIIDGVLQKNSELLSSFEDIKSQAAAGLSEASSQLSSAIGEATDKVSEALADVTGELGSIVSNTVSDLKDKASEMFGDLLPTDVGDISRVTKGLVSKISDFTKLAPDQLGNFASNLAGGNPHLSCRRGARRISGLFNGFACDSQTGLVPAPDRFDLFR